MKEVSNEYDIIPFHLWDNIAYTEKITADLGIIRSLVKEGDMVYIYFAGHGGVDAQSVSKEAYLLTYDTSPNNSNYSGKALSLNTLNEFVKTYSNKGATVTMIIDACHSGKALVVTDSIFLHKELTRPTGNEIRMLSCQSNESSVEDLSLDNGRGIFSYYLSRGLLGLADANRDKYVDFTEISTYLLKNVTEHAKNRGYSQHPIISNKLKTPYKICPINQDFVFNEQYVIASNEGDSKVKIRGIVNTLTNGLNSTDSLKLVRFLNSINFLEQNMLDETRGPLRYFLDLQQVNLSQSTKDYITDSYIAALQSKGEIILSYLIEYDKLQSTSDELNGIILEFERSLKLLQERKRETQICQAKIYYFKSMQLKLNRQFKELPEMQKKSIEFARLACESNRKFVYYVFNLGWLYQYIGDYSNAISIYKECVSLKPRFDKAYMNMGICYEKTGKSNSSYAFEAYKKALEINPEFREAKVNLTLFGNSNPEYRNKIDQILIQK